MSEFSARKDGNEGYGARDDDKQEKAPALFRSGASTSARSAGSSKVSRWRFCGQAEMRLTLFYHRGVKRARINGFALTLFQKKGGFFDMADKKDRHTVWLEPEVWDMVGRHYYEDNCSTKNEY